MHVSAQRGSELPGSERAVADMFAQTASLPDVSAQRGSELLGSERALGWALEAGMHASEAGDARPERRSAPNALAGSYPRSADTI